MVSATVSKETPPWRQRPQSLLAALHLFFLLSKCSFQPGVTQPCSVSAPPETMSPLLTVLPFYVPFCWEASRFFSLASLSKPSFRRSVERGHERRRRLTCPADGGPHLPTAASYTFTAQVWGRTLPSSSPLSDQPPRPVTKSDRDECLAPHSTPTLAQALQPRCFPASAMPGNHTMLPPPRSCCLCTA